MCGLQDRILLNTLEVGGIGGGNYSMRMEDGGLGASETKLLSLLCASKASDAGS